MIFKFRSASRLRHKELRVRLEAPFLRTAGTISSAGIKCSQLESSREESVGVGSRFLYFHEGGDEERGGVERG